ncbi:hypothetical protein [Paludisphaera rhizosphaerae]|uniref:hypothetical protein n=1 Tax=Paludisphaera rhizosphaerae TaxID=2711216 RepID=UPI0013EC2186|nr:hypothetical protein [Paludisphaera rhizosphaerae]
MFARILFMLATVAATALPAWAGTEVWTNEPVYQGVKANAPIPTWQHILNEGGIDRAGLCVIASNTANGLYQDVPEFRDGKGSAVWKLAKSREGGYYPEKLEKLFRDAGLKTAWFQAEGDAKSLCAVIEKYNAAGLPVGVTMNYGEKYGQAIHHMVSLIHIDKSLVCIVDNNFPGQYMWISRAEFERRLIDGPTGWVVALLWVKTAVKWAVIAAALVIAAGGAALMFAAVVAFVGLALRREL